MTQAAKVIDETYKRVGTAFSQTMRIRCSNGKLVADTGKSYSSNANYGYRIYHSKPATVNTLPWADGSAPPVTGWYRRYQFIGVPCVQLYGEVPCSNVGGDILRDKVFAMPRGISIPLAPWVSPDPSLVTRATQVFLEAVDDVDHDVELGIAFAERKETAELFASSLSKFSRAILRFKRTSPRGWKQILRDLNPPNWRASKVVNGKRYASLIQTQGSKIPEAWLEMTYGWRPLMADIHDALQVVDARQKANLYQFTVDKTVKRKSPATFLVTGNGNQIATAGGRWMRADYTKVELVRIACVGRIDTSIWRTLDNVGLANPASIIWEVVPFSFIIDWALPIGSYLSQWSATAGKQFVQGYRSEVVKSETTVPLRQDNIVHGPTRFLRFTEGLNGFAYFNFNRVNLYSWPAPRFPVLKNPVNLPHIASGLSLLATAMYSDIPRYVRN